MRILAGSGSLRAASTNTAVVRAAALLAPPDVETEVDRGLASLPFFDPDLDGETLPASGRGLDADGIAADPDLSARLRAALAALRAATIAGKPRARRAGADT